VSWKNKEKESQEDLCKQVEVEFHRVKKLSVSYHPVSEAARFPLEIAVAKFAGFS
jgi:hypothetical protein